MKIPRGQPQFAMEWRHWGTSRSQPAPSIPAGAVEHVTERDAEGRKVASEFHWRGRRVGRARWFASGAPYLVISLRGRSAHGYRLEYHEEPAGAVSYAEPFVRGRVHGLAKQFDVDGRLMMVSPFVRGTGMDFWCDEAGRLLEAHPIVNSRISGSDRWWNPDGKTVFEAHVF